MIVASKADDKTDRGGDDNKDDDDNFMCAGCPNGYHGYKCDARCGHCAGDGSCNQKTGSCTNGCQAGYQSLLCQTSECSMIHFPSWLNY